MNTERKWQVATVVLAITLLSTFTLGQASSSEPLTSLVPFENGEHDIIFYLLPGAHINLWDTSDIVFSTEETSHIWHGFRSTLQWETMTPYEQTEFLSTAEFRFFWKGDEVPLRHVMRYNPNNGYMWSIFYRVFPPGFFPKGMHQVRGEWSKLANGVWITKQHTGKLDVYESLAPTVTDGATPMSGEVGVRFTNFVDEPSYPIVYLGEYPF
jgi:hypothetical protein